MEAMHMHKREISLRAEDCPVDRAITRFEEVHDPPFGGRDLRAVACPSALSP
jgi:hypothetical protein